MSLRSSTGTQLARAELYAFDDKGNRIATAGRGANVMPVKETRTYVEPATVSESQDERRAREGRQARILASLTDDEATVLHYQGKLVCRIQKPREVAGGDVAEYLNAGYVLKPGSVRLLERDGLPPVEVATVIGFEEVQVERLSYDEIAEHLGVSIHMVNKLVVSANKKLRALRSVIF